MAYIYAHIVKKPPLRGCTINRKPRIIKAQQRRVLLFQRRPGIRLLKFYHILKLLGYYADVFSTNPPTVDLQTTIVRNKPDALYKTSKDYDIFIACNPRYIINSAGFNPYEKRPPKIIYVGDITSHYTNDPNRIIAESKDLHDADGIIYVSDAQKLITNEKFNLGDKGIVINNGIVNAINKLPHKPKLAGDVINVVWSGSLMTSSQSVNSHRNFVAIFNALASIPGIALHVYPHKFTPPDCHNPAWSSKIIWHNTVKETELISELAQYDIGIIVWNINDSNETNLRTSSPNKLFEYLAAGLPIVSLPTDAIVNHSTRVSCIYTSELCAFPHAIYRAYEEWRNKASDISAIGDQYSYEAQKDKIDNYIKSIFNYK